jgi:hypothetical protein
MLSSKLMLLFEISKCIIDLLVLKNSHKIGAIELVPFPIEFQDKSKTFNVEFDVKALKIFIPPSDFI